MRGSFSGGTGARARSRFFIAALVGAVIVASGAGVEAASLQFSWNAPSTNADGTPLRDLAGYRIYLGTSTPACPSGSFHGVPSPTASPSSGQTAATRISGLGSGTTYFARITAVDLTGNESTCSPTVSGVAQTDLSVTPTGTTSFGSLAVGGTADRTFTVQNTGSGTLTGSVSVAAPFSIVSGGSFSLVAGASQTVTVRFRPTATGTFAVNASFAAGGDTVSRALSGSATGTSAPTQQPAPVLSSLAPTSAAAGTSGLTLTVNGSGFVSTSVVRWNGASRPTTVVSATQLRATISAADLASAGSASVSVFTPTPGGGTSATRSFTITAPSSGPAPTTPPAAPRNVTARTLATDASGVTFEIAWTAASGAASHRYIAGHSDGGGGQQGSVTGLQTFQLKMAYHTSGAATGGYVCVQSVGPTGLQSSDQACTGLTIPARPAAAPTPPPPAPTPPPPAPTPPPAPAPPAPSTPPGSPGSPTVTRTTRDGSGVTFDLTWSAGSGATSYRYTAAFSDGSSAQQGTVATASMALKMPFYQTGAAFGGFVCVQSVNAAGQLSADRGCGPLAIPAR